MPRSRLRQLARDPRSAKVIKESKMRTSVVLALSCLCGGSLAFSAGAKSPSTVTRQAVSPTALLRQINRRSDQQALNMLSADKPLKIGVVGVTGAVGVEIIDVLGVHRCWKAA